MKTRAATFLIPLQLLAAPVLAAPAGRLDSSTELPRTFEWQRLEHGFETARYRIPFESSVVSSEVLLLRVDPVRYSIHVVPAIKTGSLSSDVKTITTRFGGIAGINGNFFDPEGRALGVVVSNFVEKQKVQRGGSVLSGVFFTDGKRFGIAHRDDFQSAGIAEALQAGPRLIVNHEPVQVKQPDSGTRRSGIAITRSQQIILYATTVRFPGATLGQIQTMLLSPELQIVDALNLDGGGSSQLFVAKLGANNEEVDIAGGDPVPVGLVIKRKN
jgi:uncharacterized protein YigE (DUF2233 family)